MFLKINSFEEPSFDCYNSRMLKAEQAPARNNYQEFRNVNDVTIELPKKIPTPNFLLTPLFP